MSYDYDSDGGGSRSQDYWAARDVEQMAASVLEQVTRYVRHCEESGRIALWHRAHCFYYGLDSKGNWRNAAAVAYGGEQGENVLIRSNHFRSLLDSVLVLTTGSRPSFSARAANSDYKSQAQTALAEGILDYYLSTKRLEDQCTAAAAYALRYGEGWMYVGWDDREGEPMDVRQTEDGAEQVEYSGDVVTRIYEPMDVARDVTASSVDDLQWLIVHRRANRFDLATRYEEHADTILNAAEWAEPYSRIRGQYSQRAQGELVSVFEMWHDRTDAIPDGRHVVVCGDAVLMDVPLPFEELPLIPMCPAYEDGTPFGYTGSWDLLPLQEALDGTISVVLTNNDAFARQKLWCATGSNVTARDLEGLTLIESNEPPQVLQMIQAQTESYNAIEMMKSHMELIMGVNSVARGEPQASLKSGSALALVHSMAIQYNSGIQKGYAKLFGTMGTMLVSRLRTFAKGKRMVEITGKRGRSMLREFEANDIGNVQRVVVELGSAVLKTSAGRKELADKFFEASLSTATPMSFDSYLEIMSTGRLDPIMERPQAHRMNIVRENELMLEGTPVKAMVTDMHAHHINEHLAMLDDPSIRGDEYMASIVLEHIQQHANLWVGCDPVLLAATGQQAAPAPMAPPMPEPPMPGGAGPMPMGNPGGNEPVAVGGATDMPNPPMGMEMARMPTMPNLPPGTDPSAVEAAQNGAMQ